MILWSVNVLFPHHIWASSPFALSRQISKPDFEISISIDDLAGHLDMLTLEEWDRWANPQQHWKSYCYEESSVIHFPFQDLNHSPLTVNEFNLEDTSLSSCPSKNDVPSPLSAILTKTGNKGVAARTTANQDRAAILSPFQGNPKRWWLGLLDGHGPYGHVLSQIGILELPRLLHDYISSSPLHYNHYDIPNIIQDIFQELNDQILPRTVDGGSVAISILQLEDQLYISNIGDARAFVFCVSDKNNDEESSATVIYTTKPHKPEDPTERERIEAAGGAVVFPEEEEGDTIRFMFPADDDDLDMALAMSRSLGDWEGIDYGLIAEPTTDVLNLSMITNSYDSCMAVGASDGLLDKIPVQKVADYLAMAMENNQSLLLALEELIADATILWGEDGFEFDYRDDITLAAHEILL